MGGAISGLVFMPPRHEQNEDVFGDLEKERVIQLRTKRGQEIAAYFLDKKAPVTVLFSHGNGEDIAFIHQGMQHLFENLNANVFFYDYTGYSINRSEPSEEDCYADIEAAWEYLRKDRQIPGNRIVLYGRSLGSGPSCYLAERLSNTLEPMGMILQSALTSAYRVAVPVPFTLPGDYFPNIDRISNIRCPILFIHGRNDLIVPFEHSLDLLNNVHSSCAKDHLWVDAGHNDVELVLHDSRELYTKLQNALNNWMKG